MPNIYLSDNKGRSGMSRIFSSMFGAVAFVLALIWLSIIGSAAWMLWYLSNHWEPVAGLALACGILLTLAVWAIFSATDFFRDAMRGWQETKRFQEDQKADAQMLQAQSAYRNSELMGLYRQARVTQAQLALEEQLGKGEDSQAVTIDGDTW